MMVIGKTAKYPKTRATKPERMSGPRKTKLLIKPHKKVKAPHPIPAVNITLTNETPRICLSMLRLLAALKIRAYVKHLVDLLQR